jgi:hypothetical protein
MVNYRIFRIDTVNSGSSIGNINALTATSVPTGSTGQKLDKVWGVMKDHSAGLASITLAGGGTLAGSHMIAGEIYPCYPAAITVSSGSFSLLS